MMVKLSTTLLHSPICKKSVPHFVNISLKTRGVASYPDLVQRRESHGQMLKWCHSALKTCPTQPGGQKQCCEVENIPKSLEKEDNNFRAPQ